ncbi:MAG TPA: DUF4260 family protein [Thermoleophilaceae bacterium]|nr:DUF4260 family protein [Thermoleophilaceae bacterium]
MQQSHTHLARSGPLEIRVLWGVAAGAALAAAIALAGPLAPVLLASLVAPDLALLAGIDRNLAPGQIAPRGVPVYNAVHRVWGPVLVAALAPALGATALVVALGWFAHVAVDRVCGYGLRTPEGFQRDS